MVFTILYAVYASIVAPFVGFFASGFKRATGIKDFSDTLPGHGGLTDRMDCISIMSIFNFFFLRNILIREEEDTVAIMHELGRMTAQDQTLVANSIAERFGLPAI